MTLQFLHRYLLQNQNWCPYWMQGCCSILYNSGIRGYVFLQSDFHFYCCLERLENKFKWQRDERFIRNLTDSVLDFEERCRRQAKALERAKLLNEQAEQLKKEADRLGNQ